MSSRSGWRQSRAGPAPSLPHRERQLSPTLSLTSPCPGDEIVSADNLYGGTYEFFHYTLPKFGRHVVFVDPSNPVAFKKAITEKTRAIYAETIGNPKLDVPDFREDREDRSRCRSSLHCGQHDRCRSRLTNRLWCGYRCTFRYQVYWGPREFARGRYR